MKIIYFSQKGNRSHQEDAFFVDEISHNLFIVCDGVGGNVGGKLASQSTIKFLSKSFSEITSGIIENAMITTIFSAATKCLFDVLSGKSHHEGMVLASFTPKEVIICHLGDSRAYVIKPSANAYWRTKDHSLVQELYDAGIITAEADMQSHPMKNRITGAISSSGRSDITEPSITRLDDLDPGDMILLCSDGVLEAFPNEEFIGILFDSALSFEEKGQMIQKQCELTSRDNNTCILIELEEGEGYSSGSNRGIEFRTIA